MEMSLTLSSETTESEAVPEHRAEVTRFRTQARNRDPKTASKAFSRQELRRVHERASLLARTFEMAAMSARSDGLSSKEIKAEMRFLGLITGNRPWKGFKLRYVGKFKGVRIEVDAGAQ
jgi:hypothetical protein